jgi:IS5 family transposase
MSARLDDHGELASLVAANLRRHGAGDRAAGPAAEAVPRCVLLKQHRQLRYRELAFCLEDSVSFRAFLSQGCRTPGGRALAAHAGASPRALYGQPPRQAAADGSCASRDNLRRAEACGVRDMAFHKKAALGIEDMVRVAGSIASSGTSAPASRPTSPATRAAQHHPSHAVQAL